MQKRIVVIEDEPDIQEIISYNLKREGFAVSSVLNGEEGLELVKDNPPDLVLLDLMLPGLDGLEICRQIRNDQKLGHLPIIMVTAKGEESDVVLGLGIGADDYVCKPFSPRELLARVQAVLRRQTGTAAETDVARKAIEFEGLYIDREKYQAKLHGSPINLTAAEFKLLYHLASHPGYVFTRQQLLNEVVGESVVIVDRNIDVHIRAIRKKLGEKQNLIETIRGIGYRFKDRIEAS